MNFLILKYYFGGAGTGKTEFCYREIVRRKDEKHFLIVPEQFSLESEKRLVEFSNGATASNCQVLSFSRLAYLVFSKTGGVKTKILENNGKKMLLRKVAHSLQNELSYYKKSLDKDGFIKNISDTITEFYNYCVDVESLYAYLQTLEKDSSLYLKMNDIYKIYKVFMEYIKNEYISQDETLDLLSLKLQGNSFFNDTVFWIDGFTGFTKQEFNVIEKILEQGKEVNFFATLKTNEYVFNDIKFYDPFYEVKSTINKISAIASNKAKIEKPILFKEGLRFKESRELGFLEKNFLSYNSEIYSEKLNDIKLNVSQNIYEEIDNVAAEIFYLVKEKNYQYKDIAIVTSDVNLYQKHIGSIFGDYLIPTFYDATRDVLSHPLVEIIRALVDIGVHNYSYESVFRFLKTKLTNFTESEIDIIENYALAYGIKGYKWKREWKYGFSQENKKGLYDKETILNVQERFLEITNIFTEKVTYKSKLTIKEFSRRIFEVLEKIEATKTLEKWIVSSPNKNSVTIKEHKQIWGKIVDVFDKLIEILGDEKVSTFEFSKILDAGLKEIDLGVIPPSQDAVIIGDFQRTRLPEIKALFVINFNEGIIPKPLDEAGLFSDEERVLLKDKGMELQPDSRRKSFEQQFLIYGMLTKPKNFLYLSYSIGTIEGKTLHPSSVIAKLSKIFTELVDFGKNSEKRENILMPKPTFGKLASALKNFADGNEIKKEYLDAYGWFSDNELYKDRLENLKTIIFEDFSNKYIDKEKVGKIYGKEVFMSATKLENFIKCPFSYFVEYNLHAKERKIYDVTSLDIGDLFHKIIEKFVEKLNKENESMRTVAPEKINVVVDACVEELVEEMSSGIFASSERLKYIVERIKRISKRSIWALSKHIKAGKFEPLGSELEFSLDTPLTDIQIQLDENRKIIITGRIDRMDIFDSDGNRYIKIIDYKSGNLKFDIQDLYFGMQLQLILYIDAFIKNGKQFFKNSKIEKEVLPGGIFYFNLKDPIVNYNGDAEEIEKLLLKEFKMSGLVLADKNVILGMDSDIEKESLIIPAEFKADGDFGKRSSIASLEQFFDIQKFVNNKIKLLGEEIFDGNIKVFPYKKGAKTGCDYCKYASVCQFDMIDKQNKYNYMRVFGSREEVLNMIAEQNGE